MNTGAPAAENITPTANPAGSLPNSSSGENANNLASSTEGSAGSLTIPKIEMVKMVSTPETKQEVITLTDKSKKILTDIVYHHLSVIENMSQGDKPPDDSMPGFFYRIIQQKYPGKDLSDEITLREVTAQFISEGKGANIRAALKLAEWYAATLQATSGRKFEESGKPIKGEKEVAGRKKIRLDSQGLMEIEESPGFWARIWPGSEVVGQDFEITGQSVMTIDASTNSLLKEYQEKFLTASDWLSGNLSSANLSRLDKSLINVAFVRSELYTLTGMKASDIQLNFIKDDTSQESFSGRNYADGRIAYFIGETGVGNNVMEILKTDAEAIYTEVKDKIQKKLEKQNKEAQERKTAEGTVRQLQAKIAEIQTEANLTDEEKKAKSAELEAEIAKLQGKYDLFTRQKLLPGEINQAETAWNEAENALRKYEEGLRTQTGDDTIDFLKWSAGVGKAESWQEIQAEYEKLLARKVQIEAQMTQTEKMYDRHIAHEPKADLRTITNSDKKGTTEKIEPNPADVNSRTQWDRRKSLLEENIASLSDSIYVNKNNGNQTLVEQIIEQEARYKKRKAYVETDEAQQLLEERRKAEMNLSAKKDELEKINKNIDSLEDGEKTEKDLKDKLKAKRDELQAVTEGGLTGENKTEIEALKALEKAFGTAEIENRENRLKELEQGLLTPPEYGVRWKDVPDVIKRSIQIIWGEEVLQAYPENKELADHILILVHSRKYLDIIIRLIKTANKKKLEFNTSATNSDGKYNKLTEVFPDSKHGSKNVKYADVSIGIANRDLINQLVADFRKEALGVNSSKTP